MAFSEKLQVDYQALTTGNGYVELTDWSTIRLTGEDRHSFLHNMCTNEIRRLSAGECCEAFCTDVKGKIVAHVFVLALEDCLQLIAVPGQAQPLIAHLDRYIIREDVTLANTTDETSMIFVGGEGVHPKAKFAGFGGLPGNLLSLATDERNSELEKLHTAGIAERGHEAWEALRIESGLPLFDIDFDNNNLPQEVNRDPLAINFNKGCYLGQETIARIDALGHVNQKVVVLQFEGDEIPAAGMELRQSEKVVGHVTSSCWSPHLEAPLALASVRRNSNELGAQLDSDLGTATVISPIKHRN